MKFQELIEEVRVDIVEAKKTKAKEVLMERLLEIEAAEKVLTKMRIQLEDFLKEDVDVFDL